MELCLLPGKPVLSPSGERLGYVKSVYLCKNLKKASSLVCVSEEEEEFVLPAWEVVCSEDGVLAGKTRQKAPAGIPCPAGSAVFDRTGTMLGRCGGVDPERGIMTVIARKRSGEDMKARSAMFFPLSRVAVGDVVLIAACREKKTTCDAKNVTQVAKTQDQSGEEEGFGVLGKQVKKQVAGVAETGETVTPVTLKRARENNKLLELAASTLTG